MQLNSAFKASVPHQAKLERLMQQLEDWQGVALKELTRTFRATGLDPHAPTFLVVAEPDKSQLPHAWRIRLAVQEHLNNAHVFTYRGSFYAVAQARTDTAADWDVIPDRLLDSLGRIVPGLPLVIKGPLRSVDEVRLGLAHAQRLVRRGQGPLHRCPDEHRVPGGGHRRQRRPRRCGESARPAPPLRPGQQRPAAAHAPGLPRARRPAVQGLPGAVHPPEYA